MEESFGAEGNQQPANDNTTRSNVPRTPRSLSNFDQTTPRIQGGYASEIDRRNNPDEPYQAVGPDQLIELTPESGWIHPSHRGTSYLRKAPKKKKKKKKRTRAPSQGPFGTLPPGAVDIDGNPIAPGSPGGYGYIQQGRAPSEGGSFQQRNSAGGYGSGNDVVYPGGVIGGPGGSAGFGGPGSHYGYGGDPRPIAAETDLGGSQFGYGGAGQDSFAGAGDPSRVGGTVPFPVGGGELSEMDRDEGARTESAQGANERDGGGAAVTYRPGQRVGGKTGKYGVGGDEENEEVFGIEHEKITKRKKKKKKKKKAPKNKLNQQDLYVDYEARVDALQAGGHTWHGLEIEDPDKFWELIVPDEEMEARDLNWVGPLSYKRVKRHQFIMHPRNRATRQPFDWWSCEMSYLPLYSFAKKSQWITPAARELGVGSSIFLLTQKAFAWLFLVLFLLNMPLMFFYAKGSGDPALQGPQSFQFTDLFAYISLGNMGVSDYTCANLNVARHEKVLRFNCPFGTMRDITQYGLQKIDNQSCITKGNYYLGENNKPDDLSLDCNYENGLSAYGKIQLRKAFDTQCYDKKYCEMKILYGWWNKECRRRIYFYSSASKYDNYAQYMNWTSWYQRNAFVREPVVWSVAFCIADQIYNPLTGELITAMSKAQFLYIILAIDVLSILIVIFFFWFLDVRSREYIEVFDKRAVEMRDFTIRFANLPFDHEYGGKDIMLQAQLWNHIEICLLNAIQGKKFNNAVEGAEDGAVTDLKQWEIVDITMHKNDMRETELLDQMDEIDRKKKTLIRKIQLLKIDKETRKTAQPQIDAYEQEIVAFIQEYKLVKAEYMKIIDEKLYEKWEITDTNGRSKTDYSVEYAYVTFRSMLAKQKAMQVFEYAEMNSAKYKSNEEKKFFGRWLAVTTPTAPSQIMWRNIIYSECNRTTRTIIVWTLAVVIICVAFYGMIIFKDWNDAILAGAGLQTKCPVEPIEASVALEDWKKPGKQRQGWTHCYCLPIYNQYGSVESTKKTFEELDPSLDYNPCEQWYDLYSNQLYLTLFAGIMLSQINSICVSLFQMAPPLFEKCLTYKDEIYLQFERVCVIQWLNVGVLYLFADFSLGFASESGVMILMGKYRDFDTDWYFDVGAKIAVAMICNSLSPSFKLSSYFVQPFMRHWFDRCCWKHLRKITNIREQEAAEAAKMAEREKNQPQDAAAGDQAAEPEGGQEGGSFEMVQFDGGDEAAAAETPAGGEKKEFDPNDPDAEYEVGEDECETQLFFQDDLNELYTGMLLEVFYPYAWFFTNMLIFFMYCGGMPIMYFFGFLHFVVSYWCHKFLMLWYHRKSYNFDEEIPLYAISLMKYAVLCHCCMIVFMFTNKRLLAPDGYDTDMHYRPKAERPDLFFRRRYDILPSQLVLGFALSLCIFYCIYRCIALTVWYCCTRPAEAAKAAMMADEQNFEGDAEMQMHAQRDNSNDIYKEYNIRGLRNLYIRSIKEFEQFRTMFNAISYDQEKLSDDYAKEFKKRLKQRILDIEDTIDVHLNLIGGLERFMDKNYMYKLAVLDANEEKIPMKDENSLRLVDITQSYQIYDSLDFAKTGNHLQMIDREVLELDKKNDADKPVYC